MKSNTIPICMSAVVLFLMFSITACNTNSRSAENNIAGTDDLKPSLSSANPDAPSSMEFTLEASSTNSNVDLDAANPSTNENLAFDVLTSDRFSISGNLTLSTDSESPTSNLQQVNPVYRAYQNVPQSISYNGYSTINYTINGSSYSASLNTEQRNMLSELQQELNEAVTYGSNGDGGPTPIEASVSSTAASSSKKALDKPLDAMTDNEIKKFLKGKGYKVKKLGNRRFAVTRKYKKDKPDKAMSITSVFNANTGRMEPGYTAKKNGKLLSKNLSKKNKANGKRQGKSKIKRAKGDYLLLDITHQETQN